MTTSDTMQAAILDAPNARVSARAGRAAGAGSRAGPGPDQGQRRQSARSQDPRRPGRPRPPAAAGLLGIDLAGIVEAVGAGVTGFRRGDEVFGMTGGVGGLQGSLAEYAAVDADLLALKPANLSMREAAALPLIFITAWEGLVDRAQVQPARRCWSMAAPAASAMSRSRSRAPSAPRSSPPARPPARSFHRAARRDAIDYRADDGRRLCRASIPAARLRFVYRHRRRRHAGCLLQRGPPLRPCRQRARLGHAMPWRRSRSVPRPIPACSRCCRC